MVTKHYFRIDRKDDDSRSGWDCGYGPVLYESGIRGFSEATEAKAFIGKMLTASWKGHEFRVVEVTVTTTERVLP